MLTRTEITTFILPVVVKRILSPILWGDEDQVLREFTGTKISNGNKELVPIL